MPSTIITEITVLKLQRLTQVHLKMLLNTYFTFNEEQDQITNPRCVFTAFFALCRPKVSCGFIEVVCKQFGIEELASGLSHSAMRRVYKLIDVLTVLVSQHGCITPLWHIQTQTPQWRLSY